MLYIVEGCPLGDIQTVQSALEVLVPLEHAREIRHAKDGQHQDTFEGDKVIGSVVNTPAASRMVLWGESLAGMSLNDFPENHSFGNGITCGARARVNGEIRVFSWVVFSGNTPIPANVVTQIRAIMENG